MLYQVLHQPVIWNQKAIIISTWCFNRSLKGFDWIKLPKLKNSLQADHYHHVAKKYEKAHSVVHVSVINNSSLAAFLSSASLATSLSGIGIVVGVPLASVVAVFGLSSAGSTAASKKLEAKVVKHEKILNSQLWPLNVTLSTKLSLKFLLIIVFPMSSSKSSCMNYKKYYILKESVRSDFAPRSCKKNRLRQFHNSLIMKK